MHIADVGAGILGANGIVGGGIPIATGAGLACKQRRDGRVALCFFSDGASNEGTFHESINLAAVWKLPVVYLVENNAYGMGTEVGRASAVSDIFRKGCAYGIANAQVNGQDALEVHRAVQEALDHARKEGPYLLEALTYRYAGHSMGDPERYRSKAEVEEWQRTRDPIRLFGEALKEKGIADDEALEKIGQSVRDEVEAIVQFAEGSPEPDDAALCEHVYVNPMPHR
jgi:pyruvate dehydrogenase E1 component alpha subunit